MPGIYAQLSRPSDNYIWSMISLCALIVTLLQPFTSASIQPVKWKLIGGDATRRVVAGRTVALELQADIASGWHIYSLTQKTGGPIPLRINLSNSADVAIRGRVSAPKPVRTFDKNFGLETELYSGRARFAVPVGVPVSSASGVRSFQLEARYQACSDKLCLPARTEKFTVNLQIARPGR